MQILLLLVVLAWVEASLDFVNNNVQRTISAAHNNAVKTLLSVKATRKVSTAEHYIFRLPSEEFGGRIAKALCIVDRESAGLILEKGKEEVVLKVSLPTKFSSGIIECSTFRVGSAARRPYPAEISQLDRQRFLLESENLRFSSPYTLDGEETSTLVFPSGKVDLLESYSGVQVSSNKVTVGPFKGNPSKDELETRLRIQYDANFPFPLAESVEREIEISHWGNVAIEEHFNVINAGAKLKGGFSRLDHAARDPRHSFQALDAWLPSEAYGIYYRDELGNVTSSNLRRPKGKTMLMQLKLRFPMYGGWRIKWYQGYSVPLSSMISKVSGSTDRYVLECDLFHPVSIVAESLILHVVLPPGATNVRIESPSKEHIVSEKPFRRYTYLDVPWTARNVLSIELKDIFGGDFTEAGYIPRASDDRIRIYYTYSDRHLFEKPLTISGSIFAILMSYMIAGRLSRA